MNKEKAICPQCGKDFSALSAKEKSHFPFCSDRCRLIDLGAWASERYVIKGRHLREEENTSALPEEFKDGED